MITSNLLDAVQGVQEALAELGEDGQVIKTTRTRDPANPTRMITTESTYYARIYLNVPKASYVADGVVVQRNSELLVDWLSLVDTTTMLPVNEVVGGVPVFNVITEQDDIVIRSNGSRLTILENKGADVNGTSVMGQHEVAT